MRRIITLLILVSVHLLPALAQTKPGPVQLRYTVDARQHAKRQLQIRVQIEGLPEGLTTLSFPNSRNSFGNRIPQVGLESGDGAVSVVALEDSQFVVEGAGEEPVKLVFSLRGESFQHLERSTYLDEDRCLLHPQDFLLQIEDLDPKVTVSFVVPDSWEVISTTRPATDGSYLVEGKRPAPFYLGRAERVQDDDGNPVSMAIEPGWPPANELQTTLLRQIRYRQNFGRKPSSKALLAVFLSTKRLVPGKELPTSGVPKLLAFTTVSPLPETPLPMRAIQQAMARALARVYFPSISNFSPALGPDRFIDYLALRALFKTRVLRRGEFLDALAADLWSSFGDVGEPPPKNRLNSKAARTASNLPTRSRWSGPLLDLALSFYGDSTQSLDALLSTGFASSLLEPITEADLRRKFRQEPQAAAALMGVWQSEETQRIGDLLRPFALLFDRRELPAFDFQLNESFQVAQLNGHTKEPPLLEAGDRVLAINNQRLVLPDDLLKCRSKLAPGQEVQLDVERRSLPLRLTQRVSKEVLLKLEINKLADADKQQKLEEFLSVESEQN